MRTTDREIQELKDQILGQVDLSKEPDDREISNLVAETCSHFSKREALKSRRAGRAAAVSVSLIAQIRCPQELLDDRRSQRLW